jgi:hypothetical protein
MDILKEFLLPLLFPLVLGALLGYLIYFKRKPKVFFVSELIGEMFMFFLILLILTEIITAAKLTNCLIAGSLINNWMALSWGLYAILLIVFSLLQSGKKTTKSVLFIMAKIISLVGLFTFLPHLFIKNFVLLQKADLIRSIVGTIIFSISLFLLYRKDWRDYKLFIKNKKTGV